MKKMMLSFLFLLAAVCAAAQVSLTAQVNKTTLTLDDELTLSVQVSGATGNMVMPELPSLPAFNVYSREIQQSTINGQTTTLFRYTMLPRFAGKATIGAVSFNYNGKTYKTDPISVTVYRSAQDAPQNTVDTSKKAAKRRPTETADPNLPPLERSLANQAYSRGNENYFLIAAVDNSKPYVNQTVTLAVRFYYNRPFYDAPYKTPAVSNIFLEEAASSQGSQTIGGVLYRYEEKRYYVTGAAPGPATIGPASIHYMTGNSPLSALDRLFGGSAITAEETAQSEPITLDVQPMPALGKPKTFYGAVGEGYSISAMADRTEVEAGEAITLNITVKGPGNLKPTADLTLPSIEGFKIYDTAATSGSIPAGNGTRRGYKVFKTVLVPSASGIYTIPSVQWSYFNPNTKSYNTIETKPLNIQVSPASKAESGFDFGAAAPTGTGFQTLGNDISYLKTTYGPQPSTLAQLSKWDIVNAGMLALLAISILFASVGRKSLAQKRSYTLARNKLKNAQNAQEVADAVSGYLQHKLKISTGSLPLKGIVGALKKHAVTPATAETFSLLWQRLDAARFAPAELGDQSTQGLADQAKNILKLLEEESK